MYIDGCEHTFAHLTQTILPEHLARLRTELPHARPAADFAEDSTGPVTLARRLGRTGDFSGCYVLLDNARPVYVGISRKVLSRLRQHLRGRTHFDASLAYAIAQRRRPTKGHRSTAMAIPDFRAEFEQARKYLSGLSVSFVEIENPLELYLFEPFAAMELGTHEWNTFRTH
jgi:hypothetical protein